MSKPKLGQSISASAQALSVRSKPQVNVRVAPDIKEKLGQLRSWIAEDDKKRLRIPDEESISFSDQELTSESAFVSRLLRHVVLQCYPHVLEQKESEAVLQDMKDGCLDPEELRNKSIERGLWPWEPNYSEALWSEILVDMTRFYEQHFSGSLIHSAAEEEALLRKQLAVLKHENNELKNTLRQLQELVGKLDPV